jgi:hypothetical protein
VWEEEGRKVIKSMRSSFQLSSFSQGSQESEDVRIVRKYD